MVRNEVVSLIRGLIFFGDSIFAGTGASDRQVGCAKLVKASLYDVPVSIRSRNRDTSQMALQRITIDVLERPEYSHVVVLFGNNDCWLKKNREPYISLGRFENNLTQMIRLIRNHKQTPLICNLQPIDNQKFIKYHPEYEYCRTIDLNPFEWQKQYSEISEVVCKNGNVTLIDIRSILEKETASVLSNDGIHPNDKGHSLIAKEIIGELEKLNPKLEIQEKISSRAAS